MAVIDKVEVPFKLYKLVCLLENTVFVETIFIEAYEKCSNTVFATIIIQFYSASGPVTSDTGLHIALAVKQICFAIDFERSGSCFIVSSIFIISGAIPVTETCVCFFPNAGCQTTVFKHVCDIVICTLFAIMACERSLIKIIPLASNVDPTGLEAGNGVIVYLAIYFNKTISCIDVAAIANELCIYYCVVVVGCFNCGTPIYYRSTYFAVCSACVACYCTC